MAKAVQENADCIVTCGGIQSNHCRATAVAAKMLNMDAYLLLRSNHPDEDPALVGNLLIDRYICVLGSMFKYFNNAHIVCLD